MRLIQRLALFAALMGGLSLSARAQLWVGQTTGVTGPVAAGVKETSAGARLWLDAINAKGGIHGQKIELVIMDDRFDPKLAAENARKLIEEQQVLALFMTRGTPHTEAVIPLLDQHGVALVGPSSGAMVLHQPVKKHVFNVRATYQREAEKAITHLHTLGIRRIAVVHVDDSFGRDGLAGALKGFEAARLTPVSIETFDRSKPNLAPLVQSLATLAPQAILLVASSSHASDSLKQLRGAGVSAQVVTLSNNASAGFVKSLGELGRGVVVTQVFPYERSVAFPLVKEAQDLARAQGVPEVSPAMLEGFAAAKVLVEGLRRAGPKPTREKVQTALENLRALDLGGLDISYSSSDHTGLDFADLSIIGTDGRFKR